MPERYLRCARFALVIVLIIGAALIAAAAATRRGRECKQDTAVNFVSTCFRDFFYSPEFADKLNSISTANWLTYRSRFGYEIKYPPGWRVFACLDGIQVFFYDDAHVPESCDGTAKEANFLIIGPVSQHEQQLETTAGRLAENFELNGADATRYSDQIAGQEGDDLIETVQVGMKNGSYINLQVGGIFVPRTLTEERMVTTFKTIP